MKKLAFSLLIFTCFSAFGQSPLDSKKYIEVRGNAEMNIEPDEMTFGVSLEEYWEESQGKDSKTKVSISEIENLLTKNLSKVGVKREDITTVNMTNHSSRADERVLFSIQLQIKVSDFSNIDEFLKAADIKGIKYMNISSRKNTKIADYQKQIQIAALKNAKQKAKYLAESIGEELGELYCISEILGNQNYHHYNDAAILKESPIIRESQVQKIHLNYTIIAKFEIK